jgi:hypothetical protein
VLLGLLKAIMNLLLAGLNMLNQPIVSWLNWAVCGHPRR